MMPWFFYKSGYMFNVKTNKELLGKDFRKLLLPFIFWSIVGYIAYIVIQIDTQNLTLRSALYVPIRSLFLNCSIPLNSALWFIPVLYLVRIIANALLKKIQPIIIPITALLIAVLCHLYSFRLMPVWISNTAWGLFFFSAAYMLKKHETNKWVIICCSIIYIISLFSEIPSIDSAKEQNILSNFLWYPYCLCGCIVFNNFCRLLVIVGRWFYNIIKIDQQKIFPIFSYVGENSMSFYLPHYIIFKLGFEILDITLPYFYSHIVGVVIICILYAAILLPISELRKKYNCDFFFADRIKANNIK